MSTRPILLGLLLWSRLATADAAAPAPIDRAQRLAAASADVDRAFRSVVERGEAPGFAWGIISDGQLVHAGAAGLREVSTRAPVEPDSAFRIASLTKSFTAAAVLTLRDAGKLSLEDRVDRWIPEAQGWKPATADAAPLTIRMLLTHGAGFPEDNPWGDRQLAITDALFGTWLRQGFLWSTSPGTRYEYSNTGFALLGRIITRVSGTPFRDYIDQQLLRPLGLTSTRWTVDSFPPGQRVHGYRKTADGWQEEEPLGHGVYGAMGGLVTTVPDLARWVAFQLSAWPPRDDPDPGPLRRSSLRQMQLLSWAAPIGVLRPTPDAPLRVIAGGYGFGLGSAQTCFASHVVGHTGGLPGWGSQIRWVPRAGVGLVAMTNVTYGDPALPGAMFEALDALARAGALEPRPVTPSPALTEAQSRINAWLARWDDAEVQAAAAENLLLDTSLEARREEFAQLRQRHGACRPDGALQPENALRGQWRLACERGTVQFFVTLAPVAPARIQQLDVTSALPLDRRMQSAATGVGVLVARWSDATARSLLAPSVSRSTLRSQLQALHALHGACKPGEVVAGNGKTRASIRYECTRAPVQADLSLDATSGRLVSLGFSKPEGRICPD